MEHLYPSMALVKGTKINVKKLIRHDLFRSLDEVFVNN